MKLRQRFFYCHSPVGARESGGGAGRARAIDGDEKDARRQMILDAAEQLFIERRGLAAVADVAERAGLAKGTVYLYFQTKEELYLELHARHVEHYFTTLIAQLDGGPAFSFDSLMALTDALVICSPSYLPLGACCIGFASGAVPERASQHFHEQMDAWLLAAGAGLERHFPRLTALGAGEGARHLKHSYAIMVGLHSLHSDLLRPELCRPTLPGMGSFRDEATLALTRYWAHVVAPPNFSCAAPPREPDTSNLSQLHHN